MRRRNIAEAGRSSTDEGMVTVFVVMFAVALVFMVGLVVDGGRLLAESRQARNVADSAARAGAQAISDDAVRTGQAVILDPDQAHVMACNFLANTHYTCQGGSTVSVVGNQVTVDLEGSYDLTLLPGASPTIRATGSACVAVGITAATC